MNERDSETKSAVVPNGAKQAEDIYGRWPWVERSVWSERMLQTLETGVKGGKWKNAYFEGLGFYSLEKAHAKLCNLKH